jgi:hypothetical protein
MERIDALELASVLGQSSRTARRMLFQLERQHGRAVVGRCGRAGRELYTTWDALERVTPLRRPRMTIGDGAPKVIASLRRQIASVPNLERRVDELEAAVEELRAKVARRDL